MITYVNTVLVSNEAAALVADPTKLAQDNDVASEEKGHFVIQNLDADAKDLYEIDANTQKIRIGIVTSKNTVIRKKDDDGNIEVKYQPIIKWTNEIKKHDIKSFTKLTAPSMADADAEDKVTIDLTGVEGNIINKLAEGGKRVIVRITYKDLPTRYRKWTESYEYVTMIDDDAEKIAKGIAAQINGQWKRARVIADAKTEKGKIILTAMKYDDDNDFDTINRAAKVRFNANLYFTDPAAEGWESLNKHYLQGAVIEKVPAKQYPAIGKLVRDRENQAYGYQGILNRGMCTWPIIQPERIADDSKVYDNLTLEFENMYRAADDIFRKTKQTVEIYTVGGTSALEEKLADFAGAPVEETGTYPNKK